MALDESEAKFTQIPRFEGLANFSRCSTVSDFAQQLSAIEEQHGEQLQQLVEAFRKRNAELRKER